MAPAYVAHLNRTVSETLTEDYRKITLPNLLETSSARTPPLFAHYAALNLLNAYGLYSKIHVSDLLDPALKAHKSALGTAPSVPERLSGESWIYLKSASQTRSRILPLSSGAITSIYPIRRPKNMYPNMKIASLEKS